MIKWLMVIFATVFLLGNLANVSFAEDVVNISEEDALKIIFPGLKNIKKEKQILPANEAEKLTKAGIKLDKEFDKEANFFTGLTETGNVSHYAYMGKTQGKWGPILYMVGIAPDGKVKNVLIMNCSERRGKGICDRKFLDQFTNKSSASPLKIKEDIKAVSSATISSKAMNEGVKKALALFDVFYLKKK